MKKLLFLLLALVPIFAQAQSIQGTEKVKLIDGDSIWMATIDQFKTYINPFLSSQTANKVFASPDGSSGTPAFRALVNNDLPTVNVAHGGTGAATFTANALLLGNGTSAVSALALGTANQVVGMNSGGTANEYKSFAVGTSGTDFAVAHSANTVTFNLPSASAANRGAVTTGTQTFGGYKTFGDGLFASASGGNPAVNISGVPAFPETGVSANTTVNETYNHVKVDCSGGAKTITLPSPTSKNGWTYTIEKSDSSGNLCAISGDFEGSVTTKYVAGQYTTVVVRCDGTEWRLVN